MGEAKPAGSEQRAASSETQSVKRQEQLAPYFRKKITRVLREPQDPEGNRGAKTQSTPSLEKKGIFKNITAEAKSLSA